MCWYNAFLVLISFAMRRAGIQTANWRRDPQPDDPMEEILTSWNNTLNDQIVDAKPMLMAFARRHLGMNDEQIRGLLNQQQDPQVLFDGITGAAPGAQPINSFPFLFHRHGRRVSCVLHVPGNAHDNNITVEYPNLLVRLNNFPPDETTLQDSIQEHFLEVQDITYNCALCQVEGRVPFDDSHCLPNILTVKPRFLMAELHRNTGQVEDGAHLRDTRPVQIGGDLTIPFGANQTENATFQLIGCVEHRGRTFNEGHFVCHLLINGTWWEIRHVAHVQVTQVCLLSMHSCHKQVNFKALMPLSSHTHVKQVKWTWATCLTLAMTCL